MIREEVKHLVKTYSIKDIKYYDSTIDYKTKFIALVDFICDKDVNYDISDNYVFIYDNDKNAIAISISENVDTLTIPDIRNKLSPITNLISLVGREKVPKDMMDRSIESAKDAVKYLAQN